MDSRDPPPAAEELADRLIAHEANGRQAAEDLLRAGERVLQRMRDHLARVLGSDGFSALEGRAVDLARRRHPFPGTANAGGTPTGPLDEALAGLRRRDPREACDALQAVCAHMIGLLFTFLGEPLTTQLIHLAWPGLVGGGPDGVERETR